MALFLWQVKILIDVVVYYWKKLTRIFFFKQKTAYEIGVRLVGSEMCIRDRFEPNFKVSVTCESINKKENER